MFVIPTLTSERLVLRPPVYADYPDYEALLLSERSRYMGGPFTRAVAWGMFCNDLAQWSLFGHGCLMIERRDTGACIGQVGINHGPLFPEKELGWLLYAEHEGQGFATEAARTMQTWAFGTLGLTRLVSYCDENNAASIRVARRLGGVPDADAPRQDPEDVVFAYSVPS